MLQRAQNVLHPEGACEPSLLGDGWGAEVPPPQSLSFSFKTRQVERANNRRIKQPKPADDCSLGRRPACRSAASGAGVGNVQAVSAGGDESVAMIQASMAQRCSVCLSKHLWPGGPCACPPCRSALSSPAETAGTQPPGCRQANLGIPEPDPGCRHAQFVRRRRLPADRLWPKQHHLPRCAGQLQPG
jgi:hypothetical protein